MIQSLEVLFSPAEHAQLSQRDLSNTACVVFDILRATSTMMTILSRGGAAIMPVSEIAEAVALRREQPDLLLAGERHGLRILKDQTGGIDFDYGNSPREFLTAPVAGRTVAMTTTNGTRALRACAGAKRVFIGSFLGIGALVQRIAREDQLLLVGSGTGEEASFEDTLAAGAVCELLLPHAGVDALSDSAEAARLAYAGCKGDLLGAMRHARNGRRLLGIPELRDDVPFCLGLDRFDFAAELARDGRVRRAPSVS